MSAENLDIHQKQAMELIHYYESEGSMVPDYVKRMFDGSMELEPGEEVVLPPPVQTEG